MSKTIDFNVEARRKLKDGINALAEAVIITIKRAKDKDEVIVPAMA